MPTGFTYASGMSTDTISLRCPVCLSHRPITRYMIMRRYAYPDELCCGITCKELYLSRLLNTVKVLCLALQGEKVSKKLVERVMHSGLIPVIMSEHLRHYYNGE